MHIGAHWPIKQSIFSIGRYLCALVVNSSIQQIERERESNLITLRRRFTRCFSWRWTISFNLMNINDVWWIELLVAIYPDIIIGNGFFLQSEKKNTTTSIWFKPRISFPVQSQGLLFQKLRWIHWNSNEHPNWIFEWKKLRGSKHTHKTSNEGINLQHN